MEKNKCGNRYSPEVRERAVRMVFEHQGEFDSHPRGQQASRANDAQGATTCAVQCVIRDRSEHCPTPQRRLAPGE